MKLKSNAPLLRTCLILGLAFLSLGADGRTESKYRFVKIYDGSQTVAGYTVTKLRPPKLLGADSVAFFAEVMGPATPAGRPVGRPNTGKPNPRASTAGAPSSAADQQQRGHIIFRFVGERGAVASTLLPRDDKYDNTFGIVAKKTFYGLDRETKGLASFDGVKQTELVLKHKEFPQLGDTVLERLDAEGDTVAFGCAYLGNFEVFSYRNGVVKSVYTVVGKNKASGIHVMVGAGKVYVLDDGTLVVCGDGEPKKYLLKDQRISERNTGLVNVMSAAGGRGYFVGEVVGGSAIYTIRDDKPELFIDKPVARYLENGLASYGETVAVIEELKEPAPESVKNVFGSPNKALVVHRGGERHVVAKAGDTLFGQVIKDFVLDRRAVDAAGNVTFRYTTVGDVEGIGLAKPE